METTGKDFVEHWSWAAEKGLMNKNTASGLRAAVSQVIKSLDNWQTVDVKNLDVEQTLTKFQNLSGKKFKPQVLATYKRRFRLAISSYLSYLEDPGNWKPRTVERQPRGANNGGKEPNATTEVPVTGRTLPSVGLVDYPFPLREGQNVRLVLPRDLKAAEVKRLAAFMATLTVDYKEGE
jgi:hypothetical protein